MFSKTRPGITAQPNSDHRGCFRPVFLGERRPARCSRAPILRARGEKLLNTCELEEQGEEQGHPCALPRWWGASGGPCLPLQGARPRYLQAGPGGASPAVSLPAQAGGGSPGAGLPQAGRASRTPLTSRAPGPVSPSTSLSPPALALTKPQLPAQLRAHSEVSEVGVE